MRINRLVLKNFRNYPELDLSVSGNMVVLTGPNAVGKTNLVEAVYFSSLFKSFRDDAEFVFLRGTDEACVSVEVERADGVHTLDVFMSQRDRIYANFKINGVKKTRKEALGFVRVVVFDPSDVELFGLSPEARRKYLNMVLSQFSPAYLEDLNAYKKILTQKQRLLSDIRNHGAQVSDLKTWNEQLVDFGSKIILARKKFIAFLNTEIAEVYSGISGFNKPVEVRYESLAGDDLSEIQMAFAEKLEKLHERELASGSALVGPHRDDFKLHSEGVYLQPFSSRGELRGQILALKILELEYLSTPNEKPILLLDDVLSELDEKRRSYLLKYLQDRFQTFITTTHPLELPAQHISLSYGGEDVAVS